MGENAMQIKGLTKRYPGFTLGPLSFDVPSGIIGGFFGENGAGKSHTIRTALGIAHPHAGAVEFFGQPLHGPAGDMRAHIGVVFDDLDAYPRFTAQDLGLIGSKTFSSWQMDAYDRYLAVLQLEKRSASRTIRAACA